MARKDNQSMQIKNVTYIRHEDVVGRPILFEIIRSTSLYKRHEREYNDLYDWHRMNFNALLIVTEGEGAHHIDCEKYKFKAGAIIPLVKGQIHHFDKENPIKSVIITFTDSFILKNISEMNTLLFLKIFHLPHIQINPEHIILIQPFFELLFREQEIKNSMLKEDIIRSILITLFLYIERLSPLEFLKSHTSRFKDFVRFKNLVSQKFMTMHNAKDYAKEMHVSYKYLNDVCKEISGNTAKAFIDSWLVTEIKRGISQRVYSMKEISFRTGFNEPTNFIRFFKKHTGFTPKEFSIRLNKI